MIVLIRTRNKSPIVLSTVQDSTRLRVNCTRCPLWKGSAITSNLAKEVALEVGFGELTGGLRRIGVSGEVGGGPLA